MRGKSDDNAIGDWSSDATAVAPASYVQEIERSGESDEDDLDDGGSTVTVSPSEMHALARGSVPPSQGASALADVATTEEPASSSSTIEPQRGAYAGALPDSDSVPHARLVEETRSEASRFRLVSNFSLSIALVAVLVVLVLMIVDVL